MHRQWSLYFTQMYKACNMCLDNFSAVPEQNADNFNYLQTLFVFVQYQILDSANLSKYSPSAKS